MIPICKRFVFLCVLVLQPVCGNGEILIDPVPAAIISNQDSCYTLINSIDFHPKKNHFCATFTHLNKIVIYSIDSTGQPEVVQTLNNPSASLSIPQHALFSPDGKNIVVVNWINQTLTIYNSNKEGLFNSSPVAIIPCPSPLKPHKPHGIAFSPCGNFLAVAYGAAYHYGKAIALFRMINEGTACQLVDYLQGSELPGVPKGITFSPDGASLIVTFCDVNSLVIYHLSLKDQTILCPPRQTVIGEEAAIFRPEDVKISSDGDFCAVTNSDHHTVTFYPFDKIQNKITQNNPCYILQNPEAPFTFPHGMAFSPDGAFIVISEFGEIQSKEDGNIVWDDTMQPGQAKINIFKIVRKNDQDLLIIQN